MQQNILRIFELVKFYHSNSKLMLHFRELDDPDIPVFIVNVLSAERGQEDKLELAAHSGKVEDVGDGNLPVE